MKQNSFFAIHAIQDKDFEHYLKQTKKLLHPGEQIYFKSLKIKKRQMNYLLGRIAAKQALVQWIGEEINFKNVEIKRGIFGHPVVSMRSTESPEVSISHCDGLVCALAFSAQNPMGLDVENIRVKNLKALQRPFTKDEIQLTKKEGPHELLLSTMLWSAREALSKVLRSGLTSPFHFYEGVMTKFDTTSAAGSFKHFPQYCWKAWVQDERVLVIVFPKKGFAD